MTKRRVSKPVTRKPAARRAPLNAAQHAARDRALDALSMMRRDRISLTKAARLTKTTPATVRRYAGSGLTRKGGRVTAKSGDNLARRMIVLTTDGPTELTLRSSRAASRVATHWNAVRQYLADGDDSLLDEIRDREIRVRGVVHILETNPAAIERHAFAGDIDYDDVYSLA